MSQLTHVTLPDGETKILLGAEKIPYSTYQALPSTVKADGMLRFMDDYPDDEGRIYYDNDTKTLCFAAGVGYDSTTKTLIL